MTKRFCDVCEKEAQSLPLRVTSKLELVSMGKAIIEVGVNFSITNHPTSYGGPPDLCKLCTLALLDEIRRRIELGR